MHQAQAEAEVVRQDQGRPGAGASTGTGTGEPYLLVRTAGEEGTKGRRGTGILRQRDPAADGLTATKNNRRPRPSRPTSRRDAQVCFKIQAKV